MSDPFFTLHAELPREGPGDRESLERALGLAGVGPDARMLDAGCGPGADIAALLDRAPEGHVTAIDTHPAFVDRVRARWAGDGRVSAVVGDMASAEGPFDLIWCAGALYFLGITEGLRQFRGKLAPGGAVAFSELVWLSDAPDPALRMTLDAEYPEIGPLATLKARIAAAGYESLGIEVLPDAAWEAYYGPLEARIAALAPGADPALAEVLAAGRAEAALWRAYRREFGYALAVVRPA